MRNSQTVEDYLEYLFSVGKDDITKLNEEDLNDLTSRAIKETDTKYLPYLERNDHSREIITMLSVWMDSEDENMGYEILSKLRNLATKAFYYDIENQMVQYAKNQEILQKESEEHFEHLNNQYNLQRI